MKFSRKFKTMNIFKRSSPLSRKKLSDRNLPIALGDGKLSRETAWSVADKTIQMVEEKRHVNGTAADPRRLHSTIGATHRGVGKWIYV